jgi:hypothetical protein
MAQVFITALIMMIIQLITHGKTNIIMAGPLIGVIITLTAGATTIGIEATTTTMAGMITTADIINNPIKNGANFEADSRSAQRLLRGVPNEEA